jgi:acyl-CoA synthetase (AMP-forming)/AMP-acid ligase II/pimeloyl-ACP methyl ester carboxylesterase
VLCVHGNPSWSFLWRNLLRAAPSDVRVIAVDQLDMGFSERTGGKRTLQTRIDDLVELTDELDVGGPVVTVAHDWGGPISLGWALRHLTPPTPEHATSDASRQMARRPAKLAGVVLTNTAVHQPEGSPAPSVIRLIRSRAMLRQTAVNTTAFIRGAYEMSRPRLSAEVRHGFMAPYLDRNRRTAIADFVADIPLDPGHESAAALDAIAAGLSALADTPAFLLWGPRDLVFGDLYLHDLERRLPHAQVHRFPGAAHFVSEDADVAGAISAWLETIGDAESGVPSPPLPPADSSTGGASGARALSDFSIADPASVAVTEMAPARRSITFGQLAEQVEHLAIGMAHHGIHAGQRVALMIPPGIDLSVAIYACWRRGATVVLVDSGLGPTGMQRALVGAAPEHLIGIDRALAAAAALRWPGRRISVDQLSPVRSTVLGVEANVTSLIEAGAGAAGETLDHPSPDDLAAVVFTSGATGPSKGVVYRHRQLMAQRDALMERYEITSSDRLVAAFAPFALYGPTMGITSIVPDMDVTKPGTLTAHTLADAAGAVDATLVFASPAALANTVATADALHDDQRSAFASVRLLLSAGAPVRSGLLSSARALFPEARAHTPYGMTEVLPVADISLDEIVAAETSGGDGVCVGHPLRSVDVLIDPLDDRGRPTGAVSADPGPLGEILVRAPHLREGYDRLWFTQHLASQPTGWHRTGDIGRIDLDGRLWVGGRMGHVIVTANGPLAPVPVEQAIERLDGIRAAAAVGVGPAGTQPVVVVVEMEETAAERHPGPTASLELIDRVRTAVAARDRAGGAGNGVDVAAVLVSDALPVDRRHNSKIDRARVAAWAGRVLSGERSGSL